MRITGIGNGKNLLFHNILNEKREVELINYSYEAIKSIKGTPVIIVYDGLCIQEFLEFAPSLKEVNYIPIFITTSNIYIFGMNDVSEDFLHNVCPKCITKQVINNDFNLKSYRNLTTETGYSVVVDSYKIELYHFCLLLLEMLDTKSLNNHYFNYCIYSNIYKRIEMKGLSRCQTCDTENYNNQELKCLLKEIL